MSAPPHCDFRTVEYGMGKVPIDKKWEACRGVGMSFGYCSAETQSDHLTHQALQTMRKKAAEQSGNLLINIGPKADGTIPDLQLKALLG